MQSTVGPEMGLSGHEPVGPAVPIRRAARVGGASNSAPAGRASVPSCNELGRDRQGPEISDCGQACAASSVFGSVTQQGEREAFSVRKASPYNVCRQKVLTLSCNASVRMRVVLPATRQGKVS